MIIYWLVLAQILFFTAARLLFLGWNWSSFHFQSVWDLLYAFLHGFRFDFSAIAILGAPCLLLTFMTHWWEHEKWRNRILVGLFVLFQLPGMMFTLVDSEFVNFTGRRLTLDSLFYYGEASGKLSQILGSYLVLVGISVLILVGYFFLMLKILNRSYEMQGSWRKISVVFFGVFLIFFVAARGGLQKKPLGFAHAQVFAGPMMNNLVMNSSFTFLQTLKRKSLPRVEYFKEREKMLAGLPGSWSTKSSLEGHRPAKPQNVVLIILESFNFDYMGKPFGDHGYTPFLDSLAERGIFFQNHFANARRSIEGIGAILGGIPAWMNEPFLSSQYMSNYFLGIGSLLAKKKYHTSFFHGGHNGTMYFDSFVKSVGIENYYGSNEYPNQSDDDGIWGIYDGPFLQWMAEKVSGFHQPFFSTVFTLSSHNPYRIPDEFSGKFPKGNLDIFEAIGYADQSLRKFFERVEKEAWYPDTLFVLTADHTYRNSRAEYDNELGQHRIPLVLFHPLWEKDPKQKPKVDQTEITSQIDILPTILDFLGAEVPERNFLTRSVFVPGERFAVTFVDGKYHLAEKEYFLTYSQRDDFQMYKRTDPAEKDPLSEPLAIKDNLVMKLKASMQYFSEGLWDNRLYYPVRR